MRGESVPASRESPVAAERAEVWPHTTRVLPWLLAGFLVMVFLVPFNSMELSIPSPVDPHVDRYVLVAIVVVWIIVAMLGRPLGVRVERSWLFLGATGLFVSLALLSVVLNVADITTHDLLNLTQNRLALLLSFVFFACFAVSALRPAELQNFSILLVVLATLTAVGVLWERRTGFNAFYDLIGGLFDPIATVLPAPTDIHPDPTMESRKTIVGPTEHGLAVTTMMVMAVPFAIVGFFEARGNKRWLYALAVGLILGAALSTERKTAVLTPIAAVLVIAVYRPRAALRMAPLGFFLVVFIHVASPGALGTISELQGTFTSDSSEGRSDDYTATSPELFAHPLLGAGYGSRDIADIYDVRILDNEYLAELLQVGLIGTLAFIAMIISGMVVAHRPIRSGDPARAGPALAASAGCLVFLVVCMLFDSMSYPQACYAFFFVGAMATVAASQEVPVHAPAPALRATPAPTAPLEAA
jgi:hypothetical protein